MLASLISLSAFVPHTCAGSLCNDCTFSTLCSCLRPSIRVPWKLRPYIADVARMPLLLLLWCHCCCDVIALCEVYPAVHICGFSALTLLVVASGRASGLWKIWVMRCLCGYLSGAKCRLFAYGPADATASRNPIIYCLISIQTGITFLAPAHPDCPAKEAVKRM